ncbi:astacin-like metalloprotease toxin 5 [Argiope bruennichi]|uniref:Metalloendopeptidase n=1 Tax=Argiope bruennichi TaxID=94029 RepID=A0A8T0EZB9_ARGBR|nr:astacin-like metalloprotease toxin 5 [Argiope bruennichi]KAF8781682.1 Astacin-like metalloprotease toxin 1 [Argiope bruennichi]
MILCQALAIILLGSCFCYGESDKEKYLEENPLENPDLFEGDIIGLDISDDRNAVARDERLWPRGVIPYVFDPGLSSTVRLQMVLKAMWKYGNQTCIRFVPRTREANYVRIYPGQGCHSQIGMTKSKSIQTLSLGKGCGYLGTVLHELGHAVGFYHEHSRSDRDKWIKIFWENIKEGQESQFKRLEPANNRLLTPFDFNSIMLYGSYTFSKDKDRLKTMVGKDGRIIEPTREKTNLSKSDIIRIRKLYNCKPSVRS